jgi:hypothetical protein
MSQQTPPVAAVHAAAAVHHSRGASRQRKGGQRGGVFIWAGEGTFLRFSVQTGEKIHREGR